MRKTDMYKRLARWAFSLKTTARRSIWGDRLFMQFRGPTTLLLSSRGARMADVLSREQVNEIAQSPAGELPRAVELAAQPEGQAVESFNVKVQPPTGIHVASVSRDGKVTFEDTKDLKEFVR